MIRVHVICEGQSEEMFVNEVLSSHFASKQIYLAPSLIGKPGHKGGNVRVARLLTDMRARLGDTDAYCTTFFDFYGLPNEFPGKQDASALASVDAKARRVCEGLAAEVEAALGRPARERLLPYVQMHEFEALLFSDPATLATGLGRSDLAGPFSRIRERYETPESINDSPETAPSKRILSLHAGYDKIWNGSLAAIDIGLDVLRAECPLFNGWLCSLEQLSGMRRAQDG